MRVSLAAAAFLVATASAAPADNALGSMAGTAADVLARQERRDLDEREKVPYDCSATKGHPVLMAFKKPENAAEASAFCSSFVQKTVIRTRRVPATIDGISTITPDAVIVPGATVTTTINDPDHTISITTATVTGTPLVKRDLVPDPPYPDFIPSGKPSGVLKAACKCIVTPPATKATVTSTITVGTTTNFVQTITADAPTVTKDVTETATVTPTAYVTEILVCANPGCRQTSPMARPYFPTVHGCVDDCRNLQGCNFVQYSVAYGDCLQYSGTLQETFEPGSSTLCPNYAFWDKRCDV